LTLNKWPIIPELLHVMPDQQMWNFGSCYSRTFYRPNSPTVNYQQWTIELHKIQAY